MTRIRGAMSRWLLMVGGVAVAVSAVACQSSPERVPVGPGGVGPVVAGGPPTSSSPSDTVGSRSPAPPTPKSSGKVSSSPTRSAPTPPAPPEPKRCRTADLAVEVGAADSATGHTGLNLALVNRSMSACRIYGYGGVQLLNAAGAELPTEQVRGAPAPQRIVLQPEGRAYSALTWVHSPEASPCSSSAFLLVTPPNETESLRVPFSHTVCENGRIQQGAYQTTPR